jgi:hypothetical protein
VQFIEEEQRKNPLSGWMERMTAGGELTVRINRTMEDTREREKEN